MKYDPNIDAHRLGRRTRQQIHELAQVLDCALDRVERGAITEPDDYPVPTEYAVQVAQEVIDLYGRKVVRA